MKNNKPVNIAVCGSNAAGLPEIYHKKASLIGKAIAEAKAVLFTGVTSGFSYEAVKGAAKAKGKIIGISGAESEAEHKERYEQVDLNLWNHIVYTGVGYKMRDVIMIRSVDAAIYIGGGVGTLVEMASAPDQKVVMGILEGSGGATELIDFIQQISHRHKPVVVKASDPETLVKKVIQQVKKGKNGKN